MVAAPMLPLAIFAVPARRAAVAAMLMIGAIPAGYVYFVSLYLQWVEGFSPVQTGLALVPSTVTVVLTATLGTRRLLVRLLAGCWLPGRRAARPGPDRTGCRPRAAHRVRRDH
ncbi:MAG TPA: hypothetical protein VNF47_00010 [Streptosporangiaceae bacterium]|nr:hypothetical protein [Streptosporangiaceae bacterium]